MNREMRDDVIPGARAMPVQGRACRLPPDGSDRRSGRAGQRGFSMIEMMVSAALGLTVTAAVIYAVVGAHASSHKQETQSRMYDMGQMALSHISDQLRMTGYWAPSSEVLSVDNPADGDPGMKGCSGNFTDPKADWHALTCASNAAGTASNALAVRWQPLEGGRNWDCTGAEVINPELAGRMDPQPDQNVVRTHVESRFYVAQARNTRTRNPALMCQSMSGDPGERTQLIADNVEHFQVDYGVSPINAAQATRNVIFDEPALTGRAARYLKAHQLNNDCGQGGVSPDSWCAVNAVRICVIIRSEDNVNPEANTPFVNCNGVLEQRNDRRYRQAFSTTVTIRNRSALNNCTGRKAAEVAAVVQKYKGQNTKAANAAILAAVPSECLDLADRLRSAT